MAAPYPTYCIAPGHHGDERWWRSRGSPGNTGGPRGDNPITLDRARALAKVCREHTVRLIPQFQCLGHQSWAKTTFPLLSEYPEFDETPEQYPENEGIYCRSWCPQHPEVNAIVFTLIDELLSAFQAKTIHIGMDEVFLIGSEFCPRCAGHNTAELFARVVNDFYSHIVIKNHCEMMMWGDRLIDDAVTGYGVWEASANNTHAAIDMIPKDIIICDWHYLLREVYPSIPVFLDKGFQVIASGWHDVTASEAFFNYTRTLGDSNMLGYLCTTWGKVQPDEISHFPALQALSKKLS